MRLTLRTLLAYLDDILEPSQAKEIGEKIAQSEFASTLTSRIRDVLRRRRLTAPDVEGTGGIDPNTVAEYLDNTLPPNAVAEVERIFLESDVHLAEVAASHQILTLVLGEPVEIVPESRERMYALGPEPRHDAELASAMEGGKPKGNGSAPPATISAKTVPVKSFSESLPPQLRRKPLWKRAFPYIAGLTAAAVFVGLILTDPSLFRGLGFGETPDDKNTPNTKLAANGGTKSESVVPKTKTPVAPAGKTGQPVIIAKIPGDKFPPIPKGLNQNPPPDVPDTGTNSKTTPGKQTPVVGIKPPVPIATLPSGKRPADGSKIPVPPGKVTPPPNAVGKSPKIQLLSAQGEGLLLRKDAKGRDWQVIPAMSELEPNDQLVAAPPFNSLLAVGVNARAMLSAGTKITLLGPSKTALSGYELHDGRIVISRPPVAPGKKKPAGQPKPTVFTLKLRDEVFRMEFATPDTVCGIEVNSVQPFGFEKRPAKDFYSAALYVSTGSVRLTNAKGNTVVVAGSDSAIGRLPMTRSVRESNVGKLTDLVQQVEAPSWLLPNGEPLSTATSRYAKMYLKEFEADTQNLVDMNRISVLDNAMAIVQDRRPLVSQYAAQALAATGSYPELVKALDFAPHEESLQSVITGLRTWLLTDAKNGPLLKSELGKVFPGDNAEIMYRLLWGFNEDDARDETTSQLLVAWLGHAHIAVRELTFQHVHRLTGRRFEYRSNLRVGQLSLAINQWR